MNAFYYLKGCPKSCELCGGLIHKEKSCQHCYFSEKYCQCMFPDFNIINGCHGCKRPLIKYKDREACICKEPDPVYCVCKC